MFPNTILKRMTIYCNLKLISFLDVDVRKQEIEDCFEQFGDLKEVWMARNPPCFAFVVYRSQRAADKALREADGM